MAEAEEMRRKQLEEEKAAKAKALEEAKRQLADKDAKELAEK